MCHDLVTHTWGLATAAPWHYLGSAPSTTSQPPASSPLPSEASKRMFRKTVGSDIDTSTSINRVWVSLIVRGFLRNNYASHKAALRIEMIYDRTACRLDDSTHLSVIIHPPHTESENFRKSE